MLYFPYQPQIWVLARTFIALVLKPDYVLCREIGGPYEPHPDSRAFRFHTIRASLGGADPS